MTALTDRAEALPGLQAAGHEQLRAVLVAFFRRRMTDAHEIDDLVQEVFLRLVRRGGFDETDNLVAYGIRTAQSVLLDRGRYRRSRQSDRHVAFDPDLHAPRDVAMDDALVARDMLRDAAAALDRLPERTRHVFLLRRIDGLSMQHVAEQLGISVSATEKHMQRAVLHLVKARTRSQ